MEIASSTDQTDAKLNVCGLDNQVKGLTTTPSANQLSQTDINYYN